MENNSEKKEEITSLEDKLFTNRRKVNLDDISEMKEKRFAPTNDRKRIEKFKKELDLEALTEATDEEKYAFVTSDFIEDLVNEGDVGEKRIDKVDNEPVYEDKEIKIRELVPTKRAKSPKAALLKLSRAVGIGSHIQIPLWHSGFWITIRPLKDIEIINLTLDLSNEITKLSRSTLASMHTIFNLPYITTAMKYIQDAIISTTLKLDEEDDIFEFINVNDIYTILWGMAKSMYPKGLDIILPCKNNYTVDPETKLPKCTYKERVHVDVDKLLWVDRSMLSTEHLAHMAKRQPNSVTKEEVKNYVESLPTNEEEIVTFQGEDGTNIEITFHIPNVKKYVDSCYFIVEEVQETLTDVIRKSNVNLRDDEKVEAIKERVLTTLYLKGYSHLIKEIRVEDGIIEDIPTIAETLEIINGSDELFRQVKEKILEIVNRKLITTIGVPNFTCPKCKEQVSDTGDIIPLAVYEYYFLLLNSRYNVIMDKQQRINQNQP